MKEIQLTQNQVAIVDDWNYESLNKYKWYAMWSPITESFYAARSVGKFPQKAIRMHREIMKTPNGMHCDHINHNTLDNREENLRNATRSENQWNRTGSNTNNKLGERCIRKEKNSFRVQVNKYGKRVFSKSYKTIEDAIKARDEELKKHFGEFSNS